MELPHQAKREDGLIPLFIYSALVPNIALLFFVSFTLGLFTAANAHSADRSDTLTRVRMGLAARSTTTMPFFVARERGFFREEGLEV